MAIWQSRVFNGRYGKVAGALHLEAETREEAIDLLEAMAQAGKDGLNAPAYHASRAVAWHRGDREEAECRASLRRWDGIGWHPCYACADGTWRDGRGQPYSRWRRA